MGIVSIKNSNTYGIQYYLAKSSESAINAATKLATGDAIIHPYEGAADLVVGTLLGVRKEILSANLKQITQGDAVLSIIDGGLENIVKVLERASVLSAQSNSGSVGDTERKLINIEYGELMKELTRIADSTSFNGIGLLDGSIDAGGNIKTNDQGIISGSGAAGMTVTLPNDTQIADSNLGKVSYKVNNTRVDFIDATVTNAGSQSVTAAVNTTGTLTVGDGISIKGGGDTISFVYGGPAATVGVVGNTVTLDSTNATNFATDVDAIISANGTAAVNLVSGTTIPIAQVALAAANLNGMSLGATVAGGILTITSGGVASPRIEATILGNTNAFNSLTSAGVPNVTTVGTRIVANQAAGPAQTLSKDVSGKINKGQTLGTGDTVTVGTGPNAVMFTPATPVAITGSTAVSLPATDPDNFAADIAAIINAAGGETVQLSSGPLVVTVPLAAALKGAGFKAKVENGEFTVANVKLGGPANVLTAPTTNLFSTLSSPGATTVTAGGSITAQTMKATGVMLGMSKQSSEISLTVDNVTATAASFLKIGGITFNLVAGNNDTFTTANNIDIAINTAGGVARTKDQVLELINNVLNSNVTGLDTATLTSLKGFSAYKSGNALKISHVADFNASYTVTHNAVVGLKDASGSPLPSTYTNSLSHDYQQFLQIRADNDAGRRDLLVQAINGSVTATNEKGTVATIKTLLTSSNSNNFASLAARSSSGLDNVLNIDSNLKGSSAIFQVVENTNFINPASITSNLSVFKDDTKVGSLGVSNVVVNGAMGNDMLLSVYQKKASTDFVTMSNSLLNTEGAMIVIGNGEANGSGAKFFLKANPINPNDIQLYKDNPELTLQNLVNTFSKSQNPILANLNWEFKQSSDLTSPDRSQLRVTTRVADSYFNDLSIKLSDPSGTAGVTNSLTLKGGEADGINISHVFDNPQFKGQLNNISAEFVRSDIVKVNIIVGEVVYSGEVNTNPDSNTVVRLNADNSSKGYIELTLAANKGSSVADQSEADKYSISLKTALGGLSFYQTREVSNFNSSNALVKGSSVSYTGPSFDKIEISDITVDPSDKNPSLNQAVITIKTADNRIFSNKFTSSNEVLQEVSAGSLMDLVLVDADGNVLDNNTKFTLQFGQNAKLTSQSDANSFASALKDGFKVGKSSMVFQVGEDVTSVVSLSVPSLTAKDLGIESTDVTTRNGAIQAGQSLTKATNTVLGVRALIGAYQSRFNSISSSLNTDIQNISTAEGTYLNASLPAEVEVFSREKVKVSIATSVLTQINEMNQGLLRLIG